MHRHFPRLIRFSLLTVSVSLLALIFQASAQNVRELKPDGTVVREIASGGRHDYKIELSKGEYLSLRVTTRDTKVFARLTTPDGIDVFGFPAVGPKREIVMLDFIADADGVHSLEIQTSGSTEDPGTYKVKIETIRPAEDADKKAAAARKLMAEAYVSTRADNKERTEFELSKYRAADALWQSVGDQAEIAAVAFKQAEAHRRLAGLAYAQGNFDEARRNIEKALRIAESLRAKATDRPAFFVTVQAWYLFYLDVLTVSAGHAALLEETLDGLETTLRDLTTLQATVSHQRTDHQLGIRDVKQVGTLIYKSGASPLIRIDYSKPQPKIVSINGDKAVLLERDLNQVFLSGVNKSQSNRRFNPWDFLNTSTQPRETFNIRLLGNQVVNNRPTIRLRLIPKIPRTDISHIDVWVERETRFPIRLFFFEKNKDHIEVDFTDVVLNPELSEKQFEVNYGNAKVIDGRKEK